MKVLVITDHDKAGSYIVDILLVPEKTNPYDVDPMLEKWIQITGNTDGCFTGCITIINQHYMNVFK